MWSGSRPRIRRDRGKRDTIGCRPAGSGRRRHAQQAGAERDRRRLRIDDPLLAKRSCFVGGRRPRTCSSATRSGRALSFWAIRTASSSRARRHLCAGGRDERLRAIPSAAPRGDAPLSVGSGCGARIPKAHLAYANLTGADLTQEQLDEACGTARPASIPPAAPSFHDKPCPAKQR